jgi:hypothetical protein
VTIKLGIDLTKPSILELWGFRPPCFSGAIVRREFPKPFDIDERLVEFSEGENDGERPIAVFDFEIVPALAAAPRALVQDLRIRKGGTRDCSADACRWTCQHTHGRSDAFLDQMDPKRPKT